MVEHIPDAGFIAIKVGDVTEDYTEGAFKPVEEYPFRYDLVETNEGLWKVDVYPTAIHDLAGFQFALYVDETQAEIMEAVLNTDIPGYGEGNINRDYLEESTVLSAWFNIDGYSFDGTVPAISLLLNPSLDRPDLTSLLRIRNEVIQPLARDL